MASHIELDNMEHNGTQILFLKLKRFDYDMNTISSDSQLYREFLMGELEIT